jgi:hypothetical protein
MSVKSSLFSLSRSSVCVAFLLLGVGVATAQDLRLECPRIEIDVPREKLAADQEARISVRITPEKPEWKFKYRWRLSSGEPISGQGTASITVRRPPTSILDATVNIAGGPDDTMCPVVAINRVQWETPPDSEEDCPTIFVSGPAGIPEKGELEVYTVSVDPVRTAIDSSYRWSISAGEIVSGQGTKQIKVRRGRDSLTVTVDVLGLPNGCSFSASESSVLDPPPEPVKIGVLHSSDLRNIVQAMSKFAEELNNNPNNQGFIFFSYPPSTLKQAMTSRENRVIASIIERLKNRDRSRLTLVRYENGADLVEFWRVPPGAVNPSCSACDSQPSTQN